MNFALYIKITRMNILSLMRLLRLIEDGILE